MGKLSNWAGHSSSITLLMPGLAVCPKVVVSPLAMSSPELLAVKESELASGWPSEVVDRCHNRRLTKTRCWIGPNGVSLGPVLGASVLSSAANTGWIQDFGDAKSPYLTFNCQVDENGSYGTGQNGWLSTTLPGESSPLCMKMAALAGIEGLTPVDHVSMIIPTLGPYEPQSLQAVATKIRELAGTEYFVIAVSYGGPNLNEEWITYCRFQTRPDLTGFYGFWLKPGVIFPLVSYWNNSELTLNEENRKGRWLFPGVVAAEQGWIDLLADQNPRLHFTTDTNWGAIKHDQVDGVLHYTSFASATPVLPQVTSPVVGESLFKQGPAHSGLWVADVYHIGDPEFATETHFIGPTSYAPVTRTVTCAATRTFLRWPGERLIEMNPNMATEDRLRLRNRFFVSCIADKYDEPPLLLSSLAMYADLEEAGETIETSIFSPAMEGQPAVTFQEALTRANNADKRIFHQALGVVASSDLVSHVTLTGTSIGTSTLACGVYAGSVLLSTDKQDALFALAEGVTLVNKATSPSDPVLDFFDMTLAEIRSEKQRTAYKYHFDEVVVFKGRLPDISKLSLGRRTAQLLVQHCQNRSQLSSFVIGAMTMASSARKQLL